MGIWGPGRCDVLYRCHYTLLIHYIRFMAFGARIDEWNVIDTLYDDRWS